MNRGSARAVFVAFPFLRVLVPTTEARAGAGDRSDASRVPWPLAARVLEAKKKKNPQGPLRHTKNSQQSAWSETSGLWNLIKPSRSAFFNHAPVAHALASSLILATLGPPSGSPGQGSLRSLRRNGAERGGAGRDAGVLSRHARRGAAGGGSGAGAAKRHGRGGKWGGGGWGGDPGELSDPHERERGRVTTMVGGGEPSRAEPHVVCRFNSEISSRTTRSRIAFVDDTSVVWTETPSPRRPGRARPSCVAVTL
ncbi:hypothetical protein AXG93_1712s1470 [Marchantia polymorpha subsp. ruderalis]|uniref:Secreted protein n=1 Tax=Marchantia polymorpha subsp. ruderalis TaxID=1480154 RepID=A0A176VYZ9_MARPO|nr:hypothetical protein AXG93_1712s1470 [Marchantia polymorpha subsp. ruderalis]